MWCTSRFLQPGAGVRTGLLLTSRSTIHSKMCRAVGSVYTQAVAGGCSLSLTNYRCNCPSVEYVSLCKNERDYGYKNRFFAQGFQEVCKRQGTQMILRAAKVEATGFRENSMDSKLPWTTELSADDLRLLFQSEKIKGELFPQGRLLNFYLSYRPLEANICHLICDMGGAFISYEGDDEDHTINVWQSISPGSRKSDNFPLHQLHPERVAMVTFYYCYPTASKPCYFLDAYAKQGLTSPGDHFRAHLHRNLQTLKHFFPGQDATLPLTFAPTILEVEVMSSLREVGIQDEKPDVAKWQILYERRR